MTSNLAQVESNYNLAQLTYNQAKLSRNQAKLVYNTSKIDYESSVILGGSDDDLRHKFAQAIWDYGQAKLSYEQGRHNLDTALFLLDVVRMDLELSVIEKHNQPVKIDNLELLEKKTVFLHLHCVEEGCSNVFVKCNVLDVIKLLENRSRLNDFVEITTLNGGDPEFSLKSVTMQVFDSIPANQGCKQCCDRCLIYQKYGKNNCIEASRHVDGASVLPQLIGNGDIFYYKESDLFESVMLYSLLGIIREMCECGANVLIRSQELESIKKSDHIRSVDLLINNKVYKTINFPACSFYIYADGSIWFQPLQLNDVSLIRVLNEFVEMLEIICRELDQGVDHIHLIYLLMKE